MTPDERADISNGIWLCQSHAKLIDDDELAYPAHLLREWKETAEQMAALEAKGFEVRRARPYARLEKKAPGLFAEMRQDLTGQPLVREFIVLSRKLVYNPGNTPFFRYDPDDHEYLLSLMTILENSGAIRDITFNQVPRYNFTESFVSYLIGD